MSRFAPKTLRRMPPATREIARLANELASVQTRLANRVERLTSMEMMAGASLRVFCNNGAHANVVNAALHYVQALDDPEMHGSVRRGGLSWLRSAVALLDPDRLFPEAEPEDVESSWTLQERSAWTRPFPSEGDGAAFPFECGNAALLHTQRRNDMARTINKVELLGRVGADPEMKYTQSGTAITQLRLATDRHRQNGETSTDWHSITCWSGLAEAVNQYVAKGDRLYVAGKLVQNSYETEDGQRRHRTEIHASEVVFLDSRNGGSSEEESAVASAEEPVKAKSPF